MCSLEMFSKLAKSAIVRALKFNSVIASFNIFLVESSSAQNSFSSFGPMRVVQRDWNGTAAQKHQPINL
jgi:hypothetical protein